MIIDENIPDWFKSDNNLVSLYSSVRVVRNFKSLSFPSSKSYSDHKRIEKRIDNLISSSELNTKFVKTDLSQGNQSQVLKLQKLKVLPDINIDKIKKLRLYSLNDRSSFILINYLDHITIYSFVEGDKIDRAYENCKKILKIFKGAEFSLDKNGRFLTSSIDFYGAGIKCLSLLTLPFLRDSPIFRDILGSLPSNSIDQKKFWGLDNIHDDLILVRNRNSFSKEADNIVKEFKDFLNELKVKSIEHASISINKAYGLKVKCQKIINYDFLTFKDFMEIYYKVSVLRLISKSDIRISELNELIGAILLNSPKVLFPGRMKRSFTVKLLDKIKNEF